MQQAGCYPVDKGGRPKPGSTEVSVEKKKISGANSGTGRKTISKTKYSLEPFGLKSVRIILKSSHIRTKIMYDLLIKLESCRHDLRTNNS